MTEEFWAKRWNVKIWHGRGGRGGGRGTTGFQAKGDKIPWKKRHFEEISQLYLIPEIFCGYSLFEKYLTECRHTLFEMSPSYLIPWWTTSCPFQRIIFQYATSWASLEMPPCWQSFPTMLKSCTLSLSHNFGYIFGKGWHWPKSANQSFFLGNLEERWGWGQSLASEIITYRLRKCQLSCSYIQLSCRGSQSAEKEGRNVDIETEQIWKTEKS